MTGPIIRRYVALLTLLVVTAVAWTMYAWAAWPHHWQSRLMHLLLFMPWTLAWYATLRVWVTPEKKYRPWLMGSVPVLAAGAGEAIQFVWKAAGHDPEWVGVGFSLLGVAFAWLALCAWRGICVWRGICAWLMLKAGRKKVSVPNAESK